MTYEEFHALNSEKRLEVTMSHLASVYAAQVALSPQDEAEMLQAEVKRSEALKEVEEVARKHGLTIADLVGEPEWRGRKKRSGRSVNMPRSAGFRPTGRFDPVEETESAQPSEKT